MTQLKDYEIIRLIQTAQEFVDELRQMSYGETSNRPLPGSYDPFVAALDAARQKLMDQAIGQDKDQ